MKTYKDIPLQQKIELEGTRLFEVIRDLCAMIDAISISIFALNGELPPMEPDNGHILQGRLGTSVWLPSHHSLAAAVHGDPDPPIWITLSAQTAEEALPDEPSHSMGRLKELFESAFMIHFIRYYETHIDQVRKFATNNLANYPLAWAFARIIRNCFGHDGRVNISDPNFQPVTWHGVTYGPGDDGRAVFGNDLELPDLILLMIEMDMALDEIEDPDATAA